MKVIGKHGTYDLDLEKVTCTCPDFKFRRFKFAKMTEERRCVHLKEAMKDIPTKKSQHWSEKKRHPRAVVEPIAKKVANLLSLHSSIEKFAFTGSFRRLKPEIGDLDVIIQKKNDNWNDNIIILNKFQNIAEKTMISGPQKSSFLIKGIQVDVRFVKVDDFVFQLLHSTGSKENNIVMRSRAKKLGLSLNEYGLFKNGIKIDVKTEEEVYKILNLPYLNPSQR